MYLKLIEETPKEIFSYYEKPFYVYLSLSNICNANCVFCDVRTNKEKKCNIDIFKLIDELSILGTKYIHFTGGGEPFISNKCKEGILQFINHFHMHYYIQFFFFFTISREVSIVILTLSGKEFKSQKFYGLPKVISNVKNGS